MMGRLQHRFFNRGTSPVIDVLRNGDKSHEAFRDLVVGDPQRHALTCWEMLGCGLVA